ncbi:MAG: DUF2085 domain-containing protein [Coriobacteriia bacterium]
MMERLFQLIGFGLCHQLPERSLFAGGYQLPVCARDTGIYIGFAIGLLVLSVLARGAKPIDLPRWPVLAIVGLFIAAMGFDGVTSYAGLRQTTNDIRLITGLMTGWGLSALTLPMLNSQIWATSGHGRVPEGLPQILVWLGGLGASFVLARWLMPLMGVLYPILLVLAILVTFSAVNLVFVGLMPLFERRAVRLRDATPALLVAVGLTFVELAAVAWLRSLAEGVL